MRYKNYATFTGYYRRIYQRLHAAYGNLIK